MLFADDVGLVAASEGRLRQLVEEFERVCEGRILRVNEVKSSVIRYTRVIDGGRTTIVLNRRLL